MAESKKVWLVKAGPREVKVVADDIDGAMALAQEVWRQEALDEGFTFYGAAVTEVRSEGWIWTATDGVVYQPALQP